MKPLKVFIIAAALLFSASLRADEGMWLIQDINSALEKNMKARGLKLSAKEIYNAEAPGSSVSDAVVSIGFYCTGSLISDNGLIITNHHCAYSNIAALSTPEHDYLEEGYWAMTSEMELPVEGEHIYFLKKVFDVTDELNALKKTYDEKGNQISSRKAASMLEKRYGESTGLKAILSEMWEGEKAYISIYKVYDDVRLVAAPPVCIGYFGGETDNFTWPRHNCDFAIYRIYENGQPVKGGKSLKVSLDGYSPGSFTMVIGYPGRTDRYASSAEIDYQEKVVLPVSNEIRGAQMKIISRRMDANPAVRAKYSDRYFGLGNAWTNDTGMAACYKRFRVKDEKLSQERKMLDWIDAGATRSDRWGKLIPDLKEAYSKCSAVERDKVIFRETLLRGTFIGSYLLRAFNSGDVNKAKEALYTGITGTDPGVEKELLEYAVSEYFTNLDNYYYGPYQRWIQARFGYDFKAMADYLWDGSLVSSKAKVDAMESMDVLERDPLRRFLTDSPISVFNDRNGHQADWNRANELEREYKRALYWMRLQKDELQYPDANSTMRITYGTVGGLSPNDGVWQNWYSTPEGILQKYDPSNHDYDLNARQKFFLEKDYWGRWGFKVGKKRHGMIVDFITDNDIAGGNSGSPVLDAEGNLIGLAFDGNMESLASDTSFTEGYNKCICTDIRFVMWVLEKYAGMKRIIKEIEFT
jgi:hypothetical protein